MIHTPNSTGMIGILTRNVTAVGFRVCSFVPMHRVAKSSPLPGLLELDVETLRKSPAIIPFTLRSSFRQG
jgi:hypothetical protein